MFGFNYFPPQYSERMDAALMMLYADQWDYFSNIIMNIQIFA